LAVSSDFPPKTRPWLRLAALKDHTVRFVDDEPTCDLTDVLIEAIDEDTSVVAVSSVQYATGTVVDISRLHQSTVQVRARLIVDATQAAGAMRVDAAAWDADAVVASGYKWLGGHGGVALAVMSPRLLEQIHLFRVECDCFLESVFHTYRVAARRHAEKWWPFLERLTKTRIG
jgi:cysteine desulfurase / selenocysteine lyase